MTPELRRCSAVSAAASSYWHGGEARVYAIDSDIYAANSRAQEGASSFLSSARLKSVKCIYIQSPIRSAILRHGRWRRPEFVMIDFRPLSVASKGGKK